MNMNKIKLFIMSFWIFFLLLIVTTVDFPYCFGDECEFIGLSQVTTIANVIALFGLLALLMGALFYYQFMTELKSDLDLPVTVRTVENINYEYFALLMTIVSLIFFDYTTPRGVVLLVILVFIMGAIFMKTEMFYSNPSFAILGFHIYKATTNNDSLEGCIFITKEKIKSNYSAAILA